MLDAANGLATEEMLTIVQVAGELKIPRKSVYPLCSSGGLPHIRLGKHIRIPRSKFELYKRGELDEQGQPKDRPSDHRRAILAGSMDWAQLSPRGRRR
jgi:excisionase family DNA binding protein